MLPRMKIVALILRFLLGLMFVVFGSNAFLHFSPMPPMTGPAGDFIVSMNSTGYLQAVAALQILGGALLLIGFVPLGLLTLGPIIVNIVFFHVFMERSGLGMSVAVAAVSLVLVWYHRAAFAGLVRRS